MWERWNGDQMRGDPSMNSYNHYAYGAVADWIYRYAAGIDASRADAGFHTIYLHPNFDARLGSLQFSLLLALRRNTISVVDERVNSCLECKDSSKHHGSIAADEQPAESLLS